ncbi:hypothetical protein PF008_g25600 [Phytophthora fragariae]|uniref:FYVE-type domain-containing protein n=1 Tax=Phytophthora fragariae TaxID=53985 RepID=A0A6G0QJI1_9STRA|nr:hypothetical protein PF008_g25600 [Phytophthora fragariae]
MPSHRTSRADKHVTQTTQTEDTAVTSFALLEEPRDPRRNVRLTDRRLAEVVTRDTKDINWHLLHCSVGSWDKTPSSMGFSVYTTRTDALRRVMSSGAIKCSVGELRQVLRPATSTAYTSTMRELFGDDFVYGALVHRISSKESVGDIAVKTALFARRNALSCNEQWCFVDCTQTLNETHGKGFCVTMSSLDSEDLFAGKTHVRESDVRQIHDVQAGYAVVPTAVAKEVRVSFYAQFRSDGSSSGSFPFATTARVKKGVTSRAPMKRLKMMAHATARLAVLVGRRRLGVQKLTSKSSYTPNNTRCVCCAATMRSSTHLGLSNKKRVRQQCQLRGYYVCEGCSSEQEAQRSRDTFAIVRICDNCMERVDDALYDSIPADNSDTLEPKIHPNSAGSEAATKVLARLLRDTLVNASEHLQRQVLTAVLM